MKVSELQGAELDYWTAQRDPRCVDLSFEWRDDAKVGRYWVGLGKYDNAEYVVIFGSGADWRTKSRLARLHEHAEAYYPSSNWNQGGPIIEREQIWLFWNAIGTCTASVREQVSAYDGRTPLIAAMRAYVASKFGDTIPTLAGKTASSAE